MLLFTAATALLSSLVLTSALPKYPIIPRQTTTNSTNALIGFLYARDTSNNTYDIAGTVPDPSNPYGVQPIVGLTPYVAPSHDEYKLDYSVQGLGLVRAGSDFGGQIFWIVQSTGGGTGGDYTTGFLNTTSDASGAGATPGFTWNSSGDNTLGFTGAGFGGFYGCTALQVNGDLVLEMEFDGVVPSDGDCKPLTVGRFAGLA
ncbi:hypothetical protein MMC20_005495 [Loxospora ochrophaea]|nr:hypothetical protein [Loxospora ochrophaea]